MSKHNSVRTRGYAYNIVIEPAEEAGSVVTCVHTFGQRQRAG